MTVSVSFSFFLFSSFFVVKLFQLYLARMFIFAQFFTDKTSFVLNFSSLLFDLLEDLLKVVAFCKRLLSLKRFCLFSG